MAIEIEMKIGENRKTDATESCRSSKINYLIKMNNLRKFIEMCLWWIV